LNFKTAFKTISVTEILEIIFMSFLNGIRTFEAKGAEFELMPRMIKISWPGKTPMLRTVNDLK